MRLPERFDVVQKLSSFLPIRCLRTLQINSDMFPWDLLPDSVSNQTMMSQLSRLSNLKVQKIIPNEEQDLKSYNIFEFWIALGDVKNALVESVLEELGKFSLRYRLSLPTSNGVV